MEIDAQDAHDVHFVEKLLKRLLCDTQILEILAGARARYGMDQQAQVLTVNWSVYRRAIQEHAITSLAAFRFRKTREAIAVLREAIKLGYSDARWLEKDRRPKRHCESSPSSSI